MYRQHYFLNITEDSNNDFNEKLLELRNKTKSFIHSNGDQFQRLLCDDFYAAQIVYSNSNKLATQQIIDPQWQLINKTGISCIFQSPKLISRLIHNLADSLPSMGTFCLTISCDGFMFNKENPKDHVLLYGALLRMSLWHNATISIMRPNEVAAVKNTIESWSEILNCNIQAQHTALSSLILWRGRFHFGLPFMSNIPVADNLILSFPMDKVDYKLNQNDDIQNLPKISPYTVSSLLQILHRCDLVSLSPILIHGFKFTLSSSCNTSISALNLIHYLQSNQKVGLVARLTYEIDSTFLENKDLSSEAWKKAITKDGVVSADIAQVNLPMDTSYLNFFLFHNDCCPNNSVFGVLLRDPNEISESIFSSDFPLPDFLVENFSPEMMKQVSKALSELQQFNERKARNGIWNGDAILPKLSLDFGLEKHENILSHISCFDVQKDDVNIIKEMDKIFLPIEETPRPEIDPSDWPERRYLFAHNLIKETISPVKGTIVSRYKKQALEIKANDLGNHFEKSGEAKSQTKTEDNSALCPLECGIRPNISETDFKTLLWPELRDYNYHDVYYNVGRAEFLEEERSKLLEKYLPFETNTWQSEYKCFYVPLNNQKSALNNQTPGKATSPFIRKRKMSEMPTNLRRSPRHQQANAIVAKNFADASVSGENVKLKPINTKDIITRKISQVAKKKSPLPPKLSRMIPDPIEEKEKRKLREAVVSTLESEGVPMGNRLFNACGPRLFKVCKTFLKNGKNSSALMKHVAQAHVKQVIEFEKLQSAKN